MFSIIFLALIMRLHISTRYATVLRSKSLMIPLHRMTIMMKEMIQEKKCGASALLNRTDNIYCSFSHMCVNFSAKLTFIYRYGQSGKRVLSYGVSQD